MPDPLPATCWVLHDGAAGNRRQAVALADALALPSREWCLDAAGAARWLAPRRWPAAAQPFGAEFSESLLHSPPQLAIGCGRIAALATRLAAGAGARTVQILDPRLSPRHWDLVIAPAHDALVGANVIATTGSLNPIDPAWLLAGREKFPQLAQLASPRMALLVGGPTRATPLQHADILGLCASLEQWLAREGGSVLVCGSRRTPGDWAALLRERFGSAPHFAWFDERDGDNPFAGALGWADRLVVTPDSVNMLSEACSTALPVYVVAPDRAGGRIATFIESLVGRDRIRALATAPEPMSLEPLQETRRVARLVRERLNLR